MPFIGGEQRTTADGKMITTRPVTKELFTPTSTDNSQKKRVCAYARVSTDNEEQQTSYAAQVDFYTNLIKTNPDYEFKGVYTDEGISATSTAKREGFKRMIADALSGEFDRILTMPYGHFLGYDKGEDGKPVINNEEAEVVRLIYKLYLDGKTAAAIARHLMSRGVTAPGGCDTWHTTTIDSILTNEKYRGDALLQKKFTV